MSRERVMPDADFGGAVEPLKAKTVMPDRLSIDPASAFYDGDLIRRGVGVRFKGTEKQNVAEYCLSEGWVRVHPGLGKDRNGRKLTIKLQGAVEVWMRDEA